jgi:putative SOS response-associated peptidase YedK
MELASASSGLLAWRPSFNIAPSREVPVVTAEGTARSGRLMRWGFVPAWRRGEAAGVRAIINARGETIAEKPSFRRAWREGRCLVPATAFYEWQVDASVPRRAVSKRPWAIGPSDEAAGALPWAFGGIWQSTETAEGEAAEGFAIVTVAASAALRPIHDRMPVLLDRDAWSRWLAPTPPCDLLVSSPDDAVRAWRVGREINRPDFDGPACLTPAD